MSVPAITVTGTLQDFFGNPDPGSIVVTLAGYGFSIPRVAGTSIIPDIIQTVTAATNGFFSFQLWGNDVILPGPDSTFYIFQFRSSANLLVQAIPYQFDGSGVIDISNKTPMNGNPTPPTPAPPTAVLTNPTGAQAITGFPLTGAFAGLTNLTFSATPVFDAKNVNGFSMPLSGNVTSSTLVNTTAGQRITLTFRQDGTGSRTVVFPTNVMNAMPPDPGANKRSSQLFETQEDGNTYAIGGQISF